MMEVVIGKPLVELSELGISENHYKTSDRFLPNILVKLGLFRSNSEVRRNRPDLFVELKEPDFFEIVIGKKHIWVVVGEDDRSENLTTHKNQDLANSEDLTKTYHKT